MERQYSLLQTFASIYLRETKRFLKVWNQTILGPIITTSLFLLVFVVALGRSRQGFAAGGISYSHFLVAGLTMMAIIQNSFSNPSSSLLISKMNGNIVDLLMAPTTPYIIISALMFGAITRGVLIGFIILIYLHFFIDFTYNSILGVIYFGVMASMLLSLLGILAGIVSVKMDHLASFTNFIITPLSFLSGTFYSITRLPESVQHIIHFNPFFFMIDGFRYSIIGVSDFNVTIEALSLLGLNIVLFILCAHIWKKGYKIKQ